MIRKSTIEELASYLAIKLETTDFPQLETEIILSYILEKPKSYLYAHPYKKISNKIISRAEQLLTRRLQGTPIAYLTKKKEFFGHNYQINRSTLIPRPDTEILVQKALSYIHISEEKKLSVLEIGTGSGCISISILLHSKKNLNILATDISKNALRVANSNTGLLNTKKKKQISFKHHNILTEKLNQQFDTILSNPPYIPTDEILHLPDHIKNYEPNVALDGGPKGIEFYNRFTTVILDNLKRGGYALFEVFAPNIDTIQKIFHDAIPTSSFNLSVIDDLNNLPRVLVVKRCKL